MSTGTAPSRFSSKASPPGVQGEYEICPAGNKPSVLIAMIDLGTFNETGTDQKDKSKTYSRKTRKLAIYWETATAKQKDGKPFIFGEEFGYGGKVTPNNKLRKLCSSILGRTYSDDEDVDPFDIVDICVLLNVVHAKVEDKTYANVKDITPGFDGMQSFTRSRDLLLYHLDDGGDMPDMSWLPPIYGKRPEISIKQSIERGGDGIQKIVKAGDKTKEAPKIDAAARDEALKTINAIATEAIKQPDKSPGRDAAELEVGKMMRENGIEKGDLGSEASVLMDDCPF